MPIAATRVRAVFRKLDQDLARLSSKPRAENVHRLRTAARRLQILLGELAQGMDGDAKKLLKMLGRIRKRAGKVRDLDVALAALRTLKVARQPRRKTQLMNHLIELRIRREEKLKKTLDKATVRQIRKRLRRVEKKFKPEAGRDPLAIAKALVDKLEMPPGEAAQELLHRYRIAAKRARYAAEFATETAQSVGLIASLKHMQDALGDWHDWLLLTEAAGKHLGDVHESSLMAELHNVTGAKFRHAVSVLANARANPALRRSPAAMVPVRSPAKASRDAASAA